MPCHWHILGTKVTAVSRKSHIRAKLRSSNHKWKSESFFVTRVNFVCLLFFLGGRVRGKMKLNELRRCPGNSVQPFLQDWRAVDPSGQRPWMSCPPHSLRTKCNCNQPQKSYQDELQVITSRGAIQHRISAESSLIYPRRPSRSSDWTELNPTPGKERKHWALRPQKPLRLIRDGEVGGSGILYLTPTRYAVTTRMILH